MCLIEEFWTTHSEHCQTSPTRLQQVSLAEPRPRPPAIPPPDYTEAMRHRARWVKLVKTTFRTWDETRRSDLCYFNIRASNEGLLRLYNHGSSILWSLISVMFYRNTFGRPVTRHQSAREPMVSLRDQRWAQSSVIKIHINHSAV